MAAIEAYTTPRRQLKDQGVHKLTSFPGLYDNQSLFNL